MGDATCDATSDPTLNSLQLRSSATPTLCVDDGGATAAGTANVKLTACDVNSPNQKFVYNASTQMFRAAAKYNLCLDDGGATASGDARKYRTAACDGSSSNQQFAIVRLTGDVDSAANGVSGDSDDYWDDYMEYTGP